MQLQTIPDTSAERLADFRTVLSLFTLHPTFRIGGAAPIDGTISNKFPDDILRPRQNPGSGSGKYHATQCANR